MVMIDEKIVRVSTRTAGSVVVGIVAAGALALFVAFQLVNNYRNRTAALQRTIAEARSYEGEWLLAKVSVDPKTKDLYITLEFPRQLTDPPDKLPRRLVFEIVVKHPDYNDFAAIANDGLGGNSEAEMPLVTVIASSRMVGNLDSNKEESFLYFSLPNVVGENNDFFLAGCPRGYPALLFGILRPILYNNRYAII